MKKKQKKETFSQELKRIGKESKRSSIAVYFLFRTLVIICMILQFLRGDLNNAVLCLLSLILFMLPFFIEKRFKIELPNTLEIIIILFIFAAEILGEINNFYGVIPQWDTMLHTINGFLAAGVGFSLVDLLNKNVENIELSPLFMSIIAFCFSMTIGVLWEFYEFASDYYIFKSDMQKDRIVSNISSTLLNEDGENKPVIIENIQKTEIYSEDEDGNINVLTISNGYLDIGLIDTMKDLFVNFLGAIVFSILGYLYVLNRDKYHFINNFIPSKQKSNIS